MKDIAPELLEQIEADFDKLFESDSAIRSLREKLKKGVATYEDAQKFAVQVGNLLAKTFDKSLSSEILPDGRFYYNIAERILNTTLKKNHELISDYAASVQNIVNQSIGIGIKAQKAELNQDRIDGIIDIVSGKRVYDDIKYMMKEPIVNYSQAVVDSTLQRNVEFQGKSGLTPKVTRRTTGKACKSCAELAGSYEYPDVPKNVYQRHQNCRCIVEYDPGNGRKQNVHTKRWNDEEEFENRKSTGLERALKKDAVIIETDVQNIEKNRRADIIITNKQFGKKIGKHAQDFGLDPSKSEDRNQLKTIIKNIINNYDEKASGEWRGQEGRVDFFIKESDVIVVNGNEFITILKGGVNNERVKDARESKV